MSSHLEEVLVESISSTGLLIGEEERAAIHRVLASGLLAQGPEVAAFEAEFSRHVWGRPCVAVNSGTSGLLLGLLAIGIGPGDEVIVPSFSFAATANAVALSGARPIFVDIELAHFCIEPDAVVAAIGEHTAAIMPVHLYGHPAAMDRLKEIARTHGLALVEDAAQAHLASLGDQPVGTFGSVAAFSFYATKNMTTGGEGGLVVCADDSTARRVRLLRNQGMEQGKMSKIIGYNARMTDLHAAIGRVQLRRLPEWTAARRKNAESLTGGLEKLVPQDLLSVPRVAPSAQPAWHQYTVRAPQRDQLAATLAGLGVQTGIYYATPIHRLPAFDLDLDLPHTAVAAKEVLSLPIHPALSTVNLERIVGAVVQAVAQ
ncbi:MAG: UDP-4-amino-4-deoxy-L-arabinose--oxoglutarate aminotransferase [Aeromicrobium sp.]|nr:UDP-4-amino-4-deoxy-L-arabinose--oxoglutarate aminotransferase [Aeromicrobium sp.]